MLDHEWHDNHVYTIRSVSIQAWPEDKVIHAVMFTCNVYRLHGQKYVPVGWYEFCMILSTFPLYGIMLCGCVNIEYDQHTSVDS